MKLVLKTANFVYIFFLTFGKSTISQAALMLITNVQSNGPITSKSTNMNSLSCHCSIVVLLSPVPQPSHPSPAPLFELGLLLSLLELVPEPNHLLTGGPLLFFSLLHQCCQLPQQRSCTGKNWEKKKIKTSGSNKSQIQVLVSFRKQPLL